MESVSVQSVPKLELEDWPVDGLETIGQCPICGGDSRTLFYEGLTDRVYRCAPGSWRLHRCNGCGSAFLDPRPTQETIGLAYRRYFTHAEDSPGTGPVSQKPWANFRQALRNGYLNARYHASLTPAHWLGRIFLPLLPPLRERADRWVRHLPPPYPGARLLEIGCGNGGFLLTMRELGWDVQGVEPDVKAAQVARSRGLPVIEGVLKPGLLPDASFDAITMHHVIEHLHNPVEVLAHCHRLLRPAGVISVITPNFDSRGSKLFGKDWYPLQPPSHLVLFTTRSLARALRHTGYQNVRAHASFFGAESIFRDSARLQGNDAALTVDEGGLLKRIIARLATLFFSLLPGTSEEAVVTARKPVSPQ